MTWRELRIYSVSQNNSYVIHSNLPVRQFFTTIAFESTTRFYYGEFVLLLDTHRELLSIQLLLDELSRECCR